MESNEDMWKLEYYHGLLPREDVNELLKKDGDFLIRKSEETSGQERVYALSVNVCGQNRHVIFRNERGLVCVDFGLERGYRTIHTFIDAHLTKGDSISSQAKVVLKRGIARQKWELAHSTVTQGKELGRGAFGIVRRGSFKEPTSSQAIQVAIKEVSQTSTKDQIKEFMNEARIMRQFDHKNVIKFHGVAVGQEPLMIVMELASDGSLTDYLKKTKRSLRSKLFMCFGAAAGLDHIHSKGTIHCDIAARNCLFSQNTVKIADFGLAHRGTSKPMDKNKPMPIKWLSPDTIRDLAFNPKSDTWAYGVLCWEIFTNAQQPFEFVSNADVIPMIIRGKRLQFPPETPTQFPGFVRANIWNGDESRRMVMREVLEWIEQHIEDMIEDSTTTMRVDGGRSRASKQSDRSNK
ncbi:hypothetical protein GPALN_012958 [Globodera pallida]|nr:hypothetical protein GPALN_012957 [Globodera pallida]KAI3422450.1 hypothetical protein GPALN_012958 [Globodera pallida]